MAAGNESKLSSPFDAMLDRDRKRLDDLDGGHDGGHDGGKPGDRYGPASRPDRAPPPHPAAGGDRVASPRPAPAPSSPRRILDQRFAGSWRHEIVERRRDGDEIVVRCRLKAAADGIDLTRSGRARIDAAPVRREVVGSADGIAFSFRSEDASGAGAEDDAAERAAAHALAKCVEAI